MPVQFKARIEIMCEGTIYVHAGVHGLGLDRTDGYSWSFAKGEKSLTLAKRLARAVDAGAALRFERAGTDIQGKTYAILNCQVFGRHMNADLKRLGF